MNATRWIAVTAACLLLATSCGGVGGEADGSTGGSIGADASPGSDAASGQGSDGTEATSTTVEDDDEPVAMPDLIDLTETEARRLVDELGLDEPSVSERESFEAPGTVLEQVPSAGRVVTGTINLIVAKSIPPMPDFVGSKIADVRAWAEPRGIEVRVESVLSADSADGEVLDQVPAAGGQASQELVVTVAETPSIVNLSTVEAVEESCYTVGDINMNGAIYPKVGLFECLPASVSFNLSRDWASFETTLGVSDDGDAAASVSVEFVADGQIVQTETVVFGATNEVSLDVTGVLRLQINVTQVSGRRNDTDVGLGDARLIGSSSTSPDTTSTAGG